MRACGGKSSLACFEWGVHASLQGAAGPQPGPVASAAACLEGLAGLRDGAGGLRPADVKRGRAHLLSLILHLADHPWCVRAAVYEPSISATGLVSGPHS